MAYYLTDGFKDPFNGRHDLRKRVINAVGNADKRFQEDSLRIICAVRLATELDSSIHLATIETMHSIRKELENISPERMKDELNKMLLQDKPSFAMQMLKELKLLEFIIPELNRGAIKVFIRYYFRTPRIK